VSSAAIGQDLVERLTTSAFRDLAGARMVADVPIADDLINATIAGWLRRSGGTVQELRIHAAPGNQAVVDLRLVKFTALPLRINVVIESQPRIPDSPSLVVRCVMGWPALTWLASQAMTRAVALPPAVQLSGTHVRVDVFALLQAYGLGILVPLLDRVELTTEAGRVVLHLALRVSDSPAPPPDYLPPTGPTAPPPESPDGHDAPRPT
jgi:hypothetical protein